MADKKSDTYFMDKYFTGGWTKENLILLAKYNNWETKANIKITDNIEKLKDEILEKGNIGDTEARKLYENDGFLVYVSIDNCIQVVNAINKYMFKNSDSIEID